jgi:hypothetical protein
VAEINFLKSFLGSERQFAESYQGLNYAHNAPIQLYLRGYSRAYEKTYTGIYIQQYTKEYINQYSKEYEGTYNKEYIGLYNKQYSKDYIKTYLGEYEKHWTKTYLGEYEGTFEGTFTKQYEGFFNKVYEGQFTGNQRYNGNVTGQFEGTFAKGYEGLFESSSSPYIKTYLGLYSKQYSGNYEGQFSKQYSGIYEGTFDKTYLGQYQSTFHRDFVASWSGTVDTTRVSNQLYSGTYEKVWTHIYEGNYVKNYNRQFSKQYQGVYTKTYLGDYIQTYLGSYNKEYVGQYLQTYQKEYSRIFVKQYTKHYEALYIGLYQKEYAGIYTKNYLPNPGSYTRNFAKQFTGVSGTFNLYLGTNFDGFHNPEPDIDNLYSGIGFAQYTTNFGETYGALTFTNYHNPGPGNQYIGLFGGPGPVSGVLGARNWLRSYVAPAPSYGGGLAYSSSTDETQYGGLLIEPDPPYSPDITPVNYTGATNYITGISYSRNTYVGSGGTYTRASVFNAFYGGVGVVPTGQSYRSGSGLPNLFQDNRVFISGSPEVTAYTNADSTQYIGGQFAGPLSYSKQYAAPSYASLEVIQYESGPYVFGPPSPFPHPGGEPGPTYEGTGGVLFFTDTWKKNWILGPYERSYEGTFTKQYVNERVVQWSHQYSKEYEGTFTKQYDRLWEGVYNKQYEGGFNKTYEGAFNKDYTGLFTKQYEGFFNKTYVGHYEKAYIAQYEGTRSSTSTFLGSYIGYFDGISYEGFFHGPTYIGSYVKSYSGQYEGQFTKQYSGTYEGTFTKQYEGSFTRDYIKQWSGVYGTQYTGVYTNANPYLTQYTGQYTKTYLGLYTKTYTGQYSRMFEGAFTKDYSALYEGAFNKAYEKQYTKTYLGNYTKTYTGIYIQQYETGYIKQYSKEYEGTFTKQYIKTYGGAWSGAGPVYLGLAYFTNTYLGERTFHQTYTGTTAVQNAASGNMTNNIRVKLGDAWKDVSRIRIKEDGEWKIVQVSRVKQPNGEWAAVGIDHERVTINVTSNTANFNLGTELNNLGLSLYDKPKHVNINIANNTFIYSSNTTPALDTSLLTGSQNTLHKVKILLGTGGGIIGKGGDRGEAGVASVTPVSIQNGGDGGDAILLRDGVSLFIESYGTIAGGGGGGGAGGILSDAYGEAIPLSNGGRGAGWHQSLGYVTESSSNRNGSVSSLKYITHGGDGGLLGQLGIAAGGFNADDSSNNEANPGTNFAQYAGSGNGGLPGSAIKGYDASRVTFINSTESSVWGDSAFKFKA